MSTKPGTYSCPACTFEQSIKRPTCEVCDSANPNFDNDTYAADAAAAAAMSNFSSGDGTIVCTHCQYINVGTFIPICEGCGKNPYDMEAPLKKQRMDYLDPFGIGGRDDDDEEEEDDDSDYNDYNDKKPHDDDDDVVLFEDATQSQTTNNTQQKEVAAVEKGMDDKQLVPYFNKFILLMKEQQQGKQTSTEDQLHDLISEVFHALEYKCTDSEGQLTFSECQICLDDEQPLVTMKACGHRVICTNDFNRYLTVHIRDGNILPWIPCPAESCAVPCHVDNITQDGRLTHSELLLFLTTYMLKKLSRNENFITCVQCEKGGFIQFGPPKKQQVTCPICLEKQTIEKGVDGDLDISFKKMIKSGHLRECPTCRHLTLKEKGLCNIIECAKCGIWWNWKTREQGHNGKDLKQRARMNGTLWEPGELRYQQDLQHRDPKAFKALLERNGIKYNPNYVRGGWNE